MSVKTVAILSPGAMGHAVGRVLGAHGLRVVTCLESRSERTKAQARSGKIEALPDVTAVTAEADLILSIVPPSAALATAERVAGAMAAGRSPPFADCNAVSPETARAIGERLAAAGAPFIDACIVGPPPAPHSTPRFYASGEHAGLLAALDGCGIAVRPIGPTIGMASGLKMCYGALSKGTWALHTAVLLAAEAQGLSDALCAEFRVSQAEALRHMEAWVPKLAADSARWVGEMEEIAATFASLGVTPRLHQGAGDIFTLLARTPLAEETRATVDPNRTLQETVRVYAAELGE